MDEDCRNLGASMSSDRPRGNMHTCQWRSHLSLLPEAREISPLCRQEPVSQILEEFWLLSVCQKPFYSPVWGGPRWSLLDICTAWDQTCPAVSIPKRWLKKPKSEHRRDTCTSMFIAVVLTKAERWMRPKCPSTDKEHIYTGVLFSREENVTFAGKQRKWKSLKKIKLYSKE